MNDIVGVFGVPDPARTLRSQGITPAWSDSQVAFGGAPVWTDASGSVIVSGEVVLDNAEELRRTLGCPGSPAGELLAELAARSGSRAGKSARGMFAVVVWNTRERTLTLLRDGVGARTLYYAVHGRACWFAARLRALRRCPAVSGELSLTALRNYLTCGFVPGSETLWRDARELRPGTTVTWPGEKAETYWEPVEEHGGSEPIETHAARLRLLLEDAVRVCLPTAGPTSVFLSGGLDSSLVTALAARTAPGPVHTFAVHFGSEYPNELEHSQLVAQHCGTRHHVVALPGKRIRETLPETIAALDDPIGDPLTTPNLILGRAAAQESGVVLNGEGGDPCFGGPKNLPMLLHELYGQGSERGVAYLRAFQKAYDDLPSLLTPDVQEALRGEPPQASLLAPYLEGTAMAHYVNRLMYVNTRFKGADNILTKVSNLTSACGLLGRSPLFDRRVVDASFSIPPEFKLSGASEKAVLKRAVADLLPASILSRPKSGMLVPVHGWFQRDLRGMARSLLLSRRARIRPYINPSLVREWLAYRAAPWPRSGVKLWLLLTLELWLRAHE